MTDTQTAIKTSLLRQHVTRALATLPEGVQPEGELVRLAEIVHRSSFDPLAQVDACIEWDRLVTLSGGRLA